MPAANFITLIRQNVEKILDWSALTALVAPEDIDKHDRDVNILGGEQETNLAGRRIDLRPTSRTFVRYSNTSWRFALRFALIVNVDRLPVAELEKIEFVALRAVTFLDGNRVPGTTDPLASVAPAIVDQYVLADIDPDIDLASAMEDGWEAVIAIVVNGTVDYASLMAA